MKDMIVPVIVLVDMEIFQVMVMKDMIVLVIVL